MQIFAAATKDFAVGRSALVDSLAKLSCDYLSDGEKLSKEQCAYRKLVFSGRVQYVRLKSDVDYAALGDTLQLQLQQNRQQEEQALRIIYLSISPSLYELVASRTNRYLRSSAGSLPVQLRVVFEKPFGRDLASAIELAAQLAPHLSDREIYRVDHYLGKVGMRAIPSFRRLNPSAAAVTTISAVDVAMTETEHVAGRTSFYDEFGVIRDVMQNHLTQALVYSLMDLMSSCATEETQIDYADNNAGCGVYGALSSRLEILHSIEEAEVLMLGQYKDYHTHLQEDVQSSSSTSTTPTAAAVRFIVRRNSSVASIPVYMVAGKALSTRQMFVKVHLEQAESDGSKAKCSILYNVHGSALSSNYSSNNVPSILLSGSCWSSSSVSSGASVRSDAHKQIYVPDGWHIVDTVACDCAHRCFLQPQLPNTTHAPLPYANAYVEVMRAVIHGDNSLFVSTQELLAQWKMWDSVLQMPQSQILEYTQEYNIFQHLVQEDTIQ